MCEIPTNSWKTQPADSQHGPLDHLAMFACGCSDDAATRNMAVTAAMLALAQVGGPQGITHPPGHLLVNTGAAANDPIDDVLKQLTGLDDPKPTGDAESIERNRKWMQRQMDEIQQAKKTGRLTPEFAQSRIAEYQQASLTAFGGVRMGCYSRRHDAELGWVTDETDHVILRLDSAEDHARFQEDVRGGSPRLLQPTGRNLSSAMVRKDLSVAGSLPAGQLHDDLVGGIVNRALPVLFLPHAAAQPLKTPDLMFLNLIAVRLEARSRTRSTRSDTALPVPGLPWFQRCHARLRQRLIHFPAEYEFFIQRTIRELGPSLGCLVAVHAEKEPDRTKEACALLGGLLALAFHGVCLGVDWLGWHGYGFHAGCDRQEAVKLLAAVRGADGATISRRELQRKLQWLQAGTRDAILERLQDEGLVILNDKHVAAVSAEDYLRSIPARSGVPAPTLRWRKPPGEPPAVNLAADLARLRAASIDSHEELLRNL
jgi:hypothetical protein